MGGGDNPSLDTLQLNPNNSNSSSDNRLANRGCMEIEFWENNMSNVNNMVRDIEQNVTKSLEMVNRKKSIQYNAKGRSKSFLKVKLKIKNIGNFHNLGLAKPWNLGDARNTKKEGRNRISIQIKNYNGTNKLLVEFEK